MRNRLTELRKEIVNHLEKRGVPLSIKEIYSLQNNCDLSTIYRALDFLISKNEVETLTISCSCGLQRYYYISKVHAHFLHCENCHKFISVSYCGLSGAGKKIFNSYGFSVSRHVLYFTGLCKKCSTQKGDS